MPNSPLPDTKPQNAVRILHFADVHFGVETYGRYDAATGLNTRLIDFRNALNSAIDLAIERGVEIAVFAGDAYKTRDPSQTHQREFAACIGRLTSANIPVVLLTGNHDIPNSRGRANAIEIYGALNTRLVTVLDKPGVILTETKTGQRLQIAAIPYLTKSSMLSKDESETLGVQEVTREIASRYEEAIVHAAIQCRENPNIPTVLMGHFTVSSAQVSATQAGYLLNEPEASKDTLCVDEFDYVAMGHIHKYQDVNRGHHPPIVYSGSIERIDFGERGEAKGVVIADIQRGLANYEFVEIKTRPFIEITVDTSRIDDSIVRDPTDQILEELGRRDLSTAVVKLHYKVSPEDASLIRERDIRQALQKAFMVVAMQREVIGESSAAKTRAKLLRESLDPLDALSAYIDSKERLAKRKDALMAKANELWLELVKDDAH